MDFFKSKNLSGMKNSKHATVFYNNKTERKNYVGESAFSHQIVTKSNPY